MQASPFSPGLLEATPLQSVLRLLPDTPPEHASHHSSWMSSPQIGDPCHLQRHLLWPASRSGGQFWLSPGAPASLIPGTCASTAMCTSSHAASLPGIPAVGRLPGVGQKSRQRDRGRRSRECWPGWMSGFQAASHAGTRARAFSSSGTCVRDHRSRVSVQRPFPPRPGR